MIADVAGLVISLVVLVVGGDQFVIGVGRLAASLRVRPTVVGAVVGGFGTSLPELIVAGVATARGTEQLAVGSLVGSIVANVSLALAVAAMVAPVRVDSRTIRREAPLSVASVLLFGLLAVGGLSRAEGIAMAVGLVVALGGLLVNARLGPARDVLALETEDFFETRTPHHPGVEVTRTVLSVGVMVVGAELLVGSASALAGRLGLAEGFVGLTLVAVGTSAPVMATSIQAARRGDHDLVVGNVLGSNLFIALAGGATVAFVRSGSSIGIGLPPLFLMAGVTAASWGFMARGSRLHRSEAALLLAAYAATIPFVAR